LKEDLDKAKRYQVAVRFDKQDYARLDALAKDDNRKLADFCRLLLDWAVPHYEKAGSFKELFKKH
jgi:hypothetical protein